MPIFNLRMTQCLHDLMLKTASAVHFNVMKGSPHERVINSPGTKRHRENTGLISDVVHVSVQPMAWLTHENTSYL